MCVCAEIIAVYELRGVAWIEHLYLYDDVRDALCISICTLKIVINSLAFTYP